MKRLTKIEELEQQNQRAIKQLKYFEAVGPRVTTYLENPEKQEKVNEWVRARKNKINNYYQDCARKRYQQICNVLSEGWPGVSSGSIEELKKGADEISSYYYDYYGISEEYRKGLLKAYDLLINRLRLPEHLLQSFKEGVVGDCRVQEKKKKKDVEGIMAWKVTDYLGVRTKNLNEKLDFLGCLLAAKKNVESHYASRGVFSILANAGSFDEAILWLRQHNGTLENLDPRCKGDAPIGLLINTNQEEDLSYKGKLGNILFLRKEYEGKGKRGISYRIKLDKAMIDPEQKRVEARIRTEGGSDLVTLNYALDKEGRMEVALNGAAFFLTFLGDRQQVYSYFEEKTKPALEKAIQLQQYAAARHLLSLRKKCLELLIPK